MTAVARWLRGLHWYLREMIGEADYDHYRAAHPGCAVLSRRDFERGPLGTPRQHPRLPLLLTSLRGDRCKPGG